MRMVQIFLLLVMATVGLPADASAQERSEFDWTLQVDPLTTALGIVHLQIERRLTDHFSVNLGPAFRLYNGISASDRTFVGYGAEAGLRYYFFGGAPEGWWAQARGVIAWLEADSGVANPGGYASALGGYTAVFGGWFVLSGGAGLQYFFFEVDGLGTGGFFPAAHTALGVAF